MLVAGIVGLGFQSIALAVVALVVVGLAGEVVKRLIARPSHPERVAARLVRTELQSILGRLRRLRVNPMLTEDYLLPTAEWSQRNPGRLRLETQY